MSDSTKSMPPATWRALWSLLAVLLILPLAVTLQPSSARGATGPDVSYASDSMNRVQVRSWGRATTGGSYTLEGSSSYSMNGSYGKVKLTRGGQSRVASLRSVSVRDGQGQISMAMPSLPATGSGVYNSLLVRDKSGRSYRATLRVAPTGSAYVSLARYDGSPSQLTPLSGEYKLPASVRAGQWLTLRLTTEGTNPVTVKAKAWPRGGAEPGWQVTASDGSAQRISTSGAVTLQTYTSSSSGANTVYYDDLALDPVGTTPPPLPPPLPPTPPGGVGTTGSLPVGSASYPVPSGAIFIATTGNDANPGTKSAPVRTVAAAMSKAPVGGTVVLRAGMYHEKFSIYKRLTIQNYPGEAVWLDGSSGVTGFTPSGSRWVKTGWTYEFDHSPTYTFGAPDNGFINPAYPMAAHPDQVWIDGVAQVQVSSVSQVTPGKFYVDDAGNRLYLGTNPAGKQVRASTLARAMEIRAAGAVLRGIGVRRYAPSVPHMGNITVERSGVTLENVYISDNATTGLSLLAQNSVVTRVTSVRNGMLGVHGNQADNLVVTDLLANSNNTEHFNFAPVSGGMKISRTRGITVKSSTFSDNIGPGFWLDESVYNGKLLNSSLRNNQGHGLSLEISALMTVAGNLVQNNGGFGMKINNTSEVSIWNNTIADNGRPLNIVQDPRRGDDPSVPGHDPRRPFPDPTMPWINGPVRVSNNVLAGTTGNCLICVEDYSREFTAEQMQVQATGNVYQRDHTQSPRWVAVWSRGPANPAVFTTLAAFKSATGQEARSLALQGIEAVTSSGAITPPVVAAIPSVAISLPSSIATLLGVPAGTKQLGAFVN